MTQTKTIINKSTNGKQTFGEKLVSVLRQPIFTFTFSLPEIKKQELSKTEKTIEPKNPISNPRNYQQPTKVLHKPSTKRHVLQRQKSNPGFFTPIRNCEELGKIRFVLRACDKHRGREFTNVLHIENTKDGSRLVATDGKRLHVTEIKTRIKPGDYKPVVRKDAIILGKPVLNVNFPNWERVVPVNTVKRGYFNLKMTVVHDIEWAGKMFTEVSKEKINPKYLADLLKKSWVVYCQNEKQKALVLKEQNTPETYAVIMPLAA